MSRTAGPSPVSKLSRGKPEALHAGAALPRLQPGPAAPLGGEALRVGLLSAVCVAAFSTISAPMTWWPLAFVCLAPWAYAVLTTGRAWLAYWMSYLAGTVFFLVNLTWLYPVTGLGFVALALYLAVYWVLTAWAVRAAARRKAPMTFALPALWVATEYLRGIVMSGFPWLFVGHAFYEQLLLIQISDLVGAYGVSFVAVLVSGFAVDVALAFRAKRLAAARGEPAVLARKRLALLALEAAVLIGGCLAYGWYRLQTAEFRQGPRVAVVQHDFPLRSTSPTSEHPYVILAEYLALAAQAAREQPDLVVFPETTWAAVQNADFLAEKHRAVPGELAYTWTFGDLCNTAVAALARGDYRPANNVLALLERNLRTRKLPRLPEGGGPPVTVVAGSMAIEMFPEQTYPNVKKFNSALVYDPDGSQRPERYDKTHLVPFGEVVPFRYGRFHWLYIWLNRLSPFGQDDKGRTIEYSLTPGDGYTVFDLNYDGEANGKSKIATPSQTATRPGASQPAISTTVAPVSSTGARFGVPICYEDVMPYVIRRYVWAGGRRRVDFLLNISNDGWFLHSAELPQHLAICVFRAVENRVGIARAVNTGISGFIDPNGRLYSVVEENGRALGKGRGVVGYRVDRVLFDDRMSVYGRLGDWFAQACLIAAVVLWMDAFLGRLRRRRSRSSGASA